MSSNEALDASSSTPQAGPLNLLRPLLLLYWSSTYIPITVWQLLLSFDFGPLFNFSLFKEAWFARFWGFLGPRSRELSAPIVVPLISNNATGICLDIGPGIGEWLYLFAKGTNPRITKIYGVEPNVDMHPKLRENAINAGLGDIYEVIGCGAQELQAKAGFQANSIDTIITVQCLCSIPTPEKIIRELAPLLKPGGKWLFFEHVRTRFPGHFVAIWQRLVNIIWPHFLNGCDICRPTDEWLIQSARWSDVQLSSEDGPYDTLPHVYGTLTKGT
ncbi:S-adenosyl-L-methionine-dependent methyltransferase [Dissoconium aciculare CBS 342.82]|uniref:S-adenosyl-L-methionine-dependent methyltransferase n=1 Tax=Dissoconium aciculare CBS 342.82 TaxID=1314786 RepID=A0A6J3LYU2_9PEZI|nr:S-adenosyl-L-methionine-dependent methyltransferase [Dissoconium aciculare CBS 342.82]KAF1819802.1 S-adenosyl-L-methionine-dependent methyltransferase [Dissoconium aciculare CBS 342.82]